MESRVPGVREEPPGKREAVTCRQNCTCDPCLKKKANPECWRCDGLGYYYDDLPEQVVCECVRHEAKT